MPATAFGRLMAEAGRAAESAYWHDYSRWEEFYAQCTVPDVLAYLSFSCGLGIGLKRAVDREGLTDRTAEISSALSTYNELVDSRDGQLDETQLIEHGCP